MMSAGTGDPPSSGMTSVVSRLNNEMSRSAALGEVKTGGVTTRSDNDDERALGRKATTPTSSAPNNAPSAKMTHKSAQGVAAAQAGGACGAQVRLAGPHLSSWRWRSPMIRSSSDTTPPR